MGVTALSSLFEIDRWIVAEFKRYKESAFRLFGNSTKGPHKDSAHDPKWRRGICLKGRSCRIASSRRPKGRRDDKKAQHR